MTPGQGAGQEFINDVHHVLQAFYIPSELRKSTLIRQFGLDKEREPAGALRRVFRDAIRSLKPEDHAPRHSTAWRLYYVLTSRYIEQLSQKEVADELSLSTRQVRRYEHEAALLLSNALWNQYGLSEQTPPVDLQPSASPADGDRDQELLWLKSSVPIEVSSAHGVISDALKIMAPLIRSQNGDLRYDAVDELPPLVGQVSSIKQALLELLTGAVRAVPGGQVRITVKSAEQRICVRIRATGGQSAPLSDDREITAKITIARQLAALSGGELEVQPGDRQGFDATLLLPAADQIAVLAIDDNDDALQLLERFLSGTRYRLLVARDPKQAFDMIEHAAPQIILLDVMLPDMDGWEVLGRLREHPQSRSVAVIVSTILLQEDLALSLGAAGFLRKPFMQSALLAALDQQAALLSKE